MKSLMTALRDWWTALGHSERRYCWQCRCRTDHYDDGCAQCRWIENQW